MAVRAVQIPLQLRGHPRSRRSRAGYGLGEVVADAGGVLAQDVGVDAEGDVGVSAADRLRVRTGVIGRVTCCVTSGASRS